MNQQDREDMKMILGDAPQPRPPRILTKQELDEMFYEAEYKLQNCLRITLQVESFVTEVKAMKGMWVPVTDYVLGLLEYQKDKFDEAADYLVEKKYQLRVEHNHRDMKWYAYYAGKDQRGLFDEDIDWQTGSDTPSEAIAKLTLLLEGGKL